MDAKTWAQAALAMLLTRCEREAAFERARWALVLGRER